MSTNEMLEKIKPLLGVTGNFQDDTLTGYIEEVQAFLEDAGVIHEVVISSKAVGVIARGVSDLWNYGAGDAELSTYFMQRATQLSYTMKPEESGGADE